MRRILQTAGDVHLVSLLYLVCGNTPYVTPGVLAYLFGSRCSIRA